MDVFTKKIDLYSKLTPENHVALTTYKKITDTPRLKYADLVIDERLINAFNDYITVTDNIALFHKCLLNHKDNIDDFLIRFRRKPWEYVKPIIWGDRKKSKYYINNLTLSHRFEIYIEHLLMEKGLELGLYYGREQQYEQGETQLGIEIKRDIESRKTGNLYIEYQERLNPQGEWVKSGIFKNDNTRYFLIGDIDKFFILRKNDLLELMDRIVQNGRRYNNCRLVKARRGTSKGYIIPFRVAETMSISINDLIRELA